MLPSTLLPSSSTDLLQLVCSSVQSRFSTTGAIGWSPVFFCALRAGRLSQSFISVFFELLGSILSSMRITPMSFQRLAPCRYECRTIVPIVQCVPRPSPSFNTPDGLRRAATNVGRLSQSFISVFFELLWSISLVAQCVPRPSPSFNTPDGLRAVYIDMHSCANHVLANVATMTPRSGERSYDDPTFWRT